MIHKGNVHLNRSIPVLLIGLIVLLTISQSTTILPQASAGVPNPRSIAITPINGIYGITVDVSGKGFLPNSEIKLTFNTLPVHIFPTISTNRGQFSTSFTIPFSVPGPYAVTASDAISFATKTFTVKPTFITNSTSGSQGSTISFSGNGFTPSSQMTIRYDGTPLSLPSPIPPTNGTGGFSGFFLVPTSGSGPHTISATDTLSNTAQTPFTVSTNKNIFLNPTLGSNGTTVNISGSGFAANSVTKIRYDGVIMTTNPATITSTGIGTITGGSIKIPISKFGAHTVNATDSSANSALKQFNMVPSIKLEPSSGFVGDNPKISGYGYEANSVITIKYGGTTMVTPSTITTNSSGSFTGTFEIPPSSGLNTIDAADANLHSAFTNFTVTLPITKTLTIDAEDQNGTAIPGLFTTLSQNGPGTTLTGFTPADFTINTNAQYLIGPSEYPPYVFDHWKDSGAPSTDTAPRFVNITSDTILTAVYVNNLVTLNATTGSVGTIVNVTGNTMPPNNAYNFSAISPITIKYEGNPVTTIPSSITTNATGAFLATFEVPASANGAHGIQVIDGDGHNWNGTFIVGPEASIIINPPSTFNGNTQNITGTHFAPHSRVIISYDGQQALNAFDVIPAVNPLDTETNNAGRFTTIFEIPFSPQGSHTISASDGSNVALTSFTVTPNAMLLSPLTGVSGTRVNFHISGFDANSTVTVKFNGAGRTITTDAIQGVKTSEEGELPGSFTVPSIATGTYPIVFSDGAAHTFSSSFVVTSSSTPVFSVQNLLTGLVPPTSSDGPDAFAFIPDSGPGVNGSGNFMIGYKNGTVIVYKNTGGSNLVPVQQAVKFVDVPAIQGCFEDAGLLGIAFDPQYNTTHQVYVYSTVLTSGSGCDPINPPGIENRVMRYTTMTDGSGNIVATSSTPEIILGGILAGTDLNGGHLVFDNQGNLVISTGETYRFHSAQDLTGLAGKVLKIKPLATPVNGKLYLIPPGNPYSSGVDPTTRKEIFSSGLRNPYSFDIDSQTGKIYLSDIGFHTYETVLDSTSPHNFGWPYYEGPTLPNPQHLANFANPIYWYPHAGIEPSTGFTADLEAIIGGSFYHGSTYPAKYSGAYFFGDYAIGQIQALLSNSTHPIDPASGVPKAQTDTVITGLNFAPIATAVWNGKLYYTTLTGEFAVLNYDLPPP